MKLSYAVALILSAACVAPAHAQGFLDHIEGTALVNGGGEGAPPARELVQQFLQLSGQARPGGVALDGADEGAERDRRVSCPRQVMLHQHTGATGEHVGGMR